MKDGDRKVRVLLVDDHLVVRAGLRAILEDEEDLELVAEAGSMADAIAQFTEHHPDLVLADLHLPDGNGADLIARLAQIAPATRFVMLTAHMGSRDIDSSLRSGAHAYLFKDAPTEELLTAIRTVARGGRYLPPAVSRIVEQHLHHPELTQRERDVLDWVVRGLGNREIGVRLEISEETVKTHLKNILEKLGARSRSQAIAISMKTGLVRPEDI